MKGAAAGQPGTIQVLDFPEPVVGAGDVILSTLACGVCATDLKSVQKGSKNVQYALGHEVCGRVLEAGVQSGWKVGQRAVVAPYLPCGACYYCRKGQPTLCTHLFETSIQPGGMAEKVFVPAGLVQRGLIPAPDCLSDEHAALAEPLGCAVKGIEDSGVGPGISVLVIGDGPMGALSAAAARAYGAFPVIVAGLTPHRLETARRSFADETIDVSQVDLAAETRRFTGGRGADVVIAAVSSGEVLETALRCVRPGGMVNAFAGVPEGTTVALDVRQLHYQQIYLTGSFGTAPEHMERALRLLEYGKVDGGAIVSACFPFSEVEAAVEYALRQRGLKAVVMF